MRFTNATATALMAAGAVAAGAAGPKPNPADYPWTGTVKCSFSRVYNGQLLVRAGILVDGRMLEMSTTNALVPVAPGDYKLRVVKDKREKPYEVDQTYEMLMPDGTTRSFTVTGVGVGICSSAAAS